MEEKIQALRDAIEKAKNIVFFGGAGVSTESGIPDFRGKNGLYKEKHEYSPESYFSLRLLKTDPEAFYSFQRQRLLSMHGEPNAAHKKLAELEQQGKLRAVLTQNVDGLHQAAGSKNVLELHGTLQSARCLRCHKSYPISAVRDSAGIPRCKLCRGMIRPDTVLYGEKPDGRLLKKAVSYIRAADMLIVGGTSLQVAPADTLVHEFKTHPLVIINLGITPLDDRADIVIHEPIGKVFSAL
jgi:NAD-dependent deacetylase